MSSTTTYLMRHVEICFNTVLLGDSGNELTMTCKLSDSADWKAIHDAVNRAAGAFLSGLPCERVDDVRLPGDEAMIQLSLEYAQIADDNCDSTSIGMTDVETVSNGDLSDACAALLARTMPRFKRLVTLITILEGGGQ